MKVKIPTLSGKQRKQLDETIYREMERQSSDHLKNMSRNLVAIVLYALRESEGWGKVKLERFGENFAPIIKEMTEKYDIPEESLSWLANEKIKALGIDIDSLCDKFDLFKGEVQK